VTRLQILRKITFFRVISTVILLAGFWLLLIVTFGIFRDWQYLRFFLLCVMGFAFLIITYLIRQ
jgi:hypothetical protein